ncbi:YaeQ family protein [Rhodanobacter aciditrophus]|uniref:YaeQ family protein n=1 Tax=Rhodanobacter aciditrophus TaxID=1623218 RepID=UPI003CF02D3B
MALTATIHKAELSISDMDRHYYATHALTLARHPSETEERLMVRLLAFALYADERLEFGKGLSDTDEPALWRKAYTGEIELWIDVGLPDETRLRKACNQSRRVVVLAYGGQAIDVWWSRIAGTLARHDNLSVLAIAPADLQPLAALCERAMRLQCLIQDGELQLIAGDLALPIRPDIRMGDYAAA